MNVYVALCEKILFMPPPAFLWSFRRQPLILNSTWEPILLKPFTFTHEAGVRKTERQNKESQRYELWDHPNRAVHLHPGTDKSEGKSCVALQRYNFPLPIWLPPLRTLLASKDPGSLLARNPLKQTCFKLQKLPTVCFKQYTKAGRSSLWRREAFRADLSMEDEKKAKQSEAK